MGGPDRELVELYGNENLIKESGEALPTAAAIAAAILGLGAMMSDKKHQDELREEAARVNEMARLLEAKRMEATIDALMKQGSVRKANLKKIASIRNEALRQYGYAHDVGILMAQQAMEKDAFGAFLARGAGKLLGGLGKGLSAASKPLRMGGATSRFQQAAGGVISPNWARGPSMVSRMGARAGGGMQSAGARMQAVGGAPATRRIQQAATGAVPRARKPLIGWKGKALMGGALLGTGYLGLKGLQAGRDVLVHGTAPRYGGSPMYHQVSPWGYPQ